jgi:hypothetical protein
MDKESSTSLSLSSICQELGLEPQFLVDLAETAETFYHTFEKPKRSGGTRTIAASQGRLKRIQRMILDGLLQDIICQHQPAQLWRIWRLWI